MNNRLMHKLLTSRRGLSIAEVMISLALITIISTAAISIAVASLQFEAKYRSEVTALRDCESIAACVRYAESAETLTPLLETLAFEDISSVQDGVEYTYTLRKPNCTITLTVNFDDRQYTITAVDQNGVPIY